MIQQALSEVRMRTLLDGLPATLGVLANDDVCRRDYARYVSDMYPSNHRGNAPGLDMAVDFIRRLWNDICANRTGSTPGTLPRPGVVACRSGVQEQWAKQTRPRQGTSLETSLRIPPGYRGNPTVRGILAQPADRDLVGANTHMWRRPGSAAERGCPGHLSGKANTGLQVAGFPACRRL